MAGIKIYVVDDDPDTQEILKTLIEGWNFDPILFDHGAKVMEKVESDQPQLILLDVMLPDMDGITICKRLRTNPATKKIPIVMLTSLSDPATFQDAVNFGVTDFIVKPFKSEALKKAVVKHIADSMD